MNTSKKQVQLLIDLVNISFALPARGAAEQNWSELTKYLMPNKTGDYVNDQINPIGRNSKPGIFDSTASIFAQRLSEYVNYNLTSGDSRWAKLRFRDPNLNQNILSKSWLEYVEDQVYGYIIKSNFSEQMGQIYQDLVVLGSGVMSLTPKLTDGRMSGLIFKSLELSSLSWEEGYGGDIESFYQKATMTGEQVVNRFNLESINGVKIRRDTRRSVIRVVAPTKKLRETIPIDSDKEYSSLVIDVEQSAILELLSFQTRTMFAARWTTTGGDPYGRGPGSLALPDAKSLDALRHMSLIAAMKEVAPPYTTTERDLAGKRMIGANEVVYVRQMGNFQRLDEPARIDVTKEGIAGLTLSLGGAFYQDAINPTKEDAPPPPARNNLQPPLNGINRGILSNLMYSILELMRGEGIIQDPPPPINGGQIFRSIRNSIEIEFTNLFSPNAQKAQSILGWVNSVSQLAAAGYPEALDIVQVDGVVRSFAEYGNVPSIVIREAEEVQAIRQQRAEQAQQERTIEMQLKAADAISKVGSN